MFRLRRIFRQSFRQRRSLNKQYVIQFDDAAEELGDLKNMFFFYPQGLKDALEVTISETFFPDDVYGRYQRGVLCDLEEWLETEHACNAQPVKLDDMFTVVGIAQDCLEHYVYKRFEQIFVDRHITIMEVHPLPGPMLHFVINVDFSNPSGVY